jgi:hypothetical protein
VFTLTFGCDQGQQRSAATSELGLRCSSSQLCGRISSSVIAINERSNRVISHSSSHLRPLNQLGALLPALGLRAHFQ